MNRTDRIRMENLRSKAGRLSARVDDLERERHTFLDHPQQLRTEIEAAGIDGPHRGPRTNDAAAAPSVQQLRDALARWSAHLCDVLRRNPGLTVVEGELRMAVAIGTGLDGVLAEASAPPGHFNMDAAAQQFAVAAFVAHGHQATDDVLALAKRQ